MTESSNGQAADRTTHLFGGKILAIPITGGTGVYRTARGEGTVQIPLDVPDQADASFVLHLR